jgi:multiple sugar transport system substrate-binding protein
MYAQGPWYIRGVLQAGIELVTAPMPRIGNRPLVWANSHVLAVVNTLDDARAAAAIRFIAWIHSHSLEWADAGQIPADNVARAKLPATNYWPYLRAFAVQVPHLVYQPSVLQETLLFSENGSTPLNYATRAVMLGQETPARAVRSMGDQINQILSSPAT